MVRHLGPEQDERGDHADLPFVHGEPPGAYADEATAVVCWRRPLDCSGVAPASRPLLYAAGGVRSFVIGFTGVALGLYLAALGYDPALVGGVVASGLAGNAVGVALVAGPAERPGRRRTLIGATVL